MGRIKTALIKRKTEELIDLHYDKLGKDYEHNKKVCSEVIFTPSKKLRNIIAGYATRIMKTRERI